MQQLKPFFGVFLRKLLQLPPAPPPTQKKIFHLKKKKQKKKQEEIFFFTVGFIFSRRRIYAETVDAEK